MTGRSVRVAWLVTFAALIVGAEVGCSVNTNEDEEVEEEASALAAAPKGLWVLEGSAQSGDIELLQLDRRDHASLVREASAPSHAAAPGVNAARAAAAPAPSATATSGPVARSASGATTLVVNGTTYSARAVGDTLKLTAANGEVLTFKRSYQLYCVPGDPGTEATLLVEMGASPKLVAVNGNGTTFPTPGEYAATTNTTTLVQQQKYVVSSNAGSKRVQLTLPWTQMNKPKVKGSIAMRASTGGPVTTTAISCERVTN